MLRTAVRAVRPAVFATRASLKQSNSGLRAFSTTIRVSSDHGAPAPQIFGPGGKPGEVPTDVEQSTGLERLQLLGELEGIEVFDRSPLDSSRIGTKADPILVPSYDVLRIVGCTGSPADSHDALWFTLHKDKLGRCTECGSVYKLDFHGDEHAGEHHH